MQEFHNILVGVDLTNATRDGPVTLDSVAAHAVRQAVWVAAASGARLTIVSVLSARKAYLRPLHGRRASALRSTTADKAAERALAELVGQAQAQGIDARSDLVHGKSWAELIRHVDCDENDLVVVGTHDPRGLRRLLLGSTVCKLLHECPCPIWISKPGKQTPPRNILVASDLSPLSDEVVSVALELGHLAGAHTHVLDVVEFPLDRLWVPSLGDATTKKYHTRIRGNARVGLQAQLERSGGNGSKSMVSIHVADGEGLPDHAIVEFIDEHDIDLLVLGSAARHGLSGVVFGNTAERLLLQVPCPVLAVKHEPVAMPHKGTWQASKD